MKNQGIQLYFDSHRLMHSTNFFLNDDGVLRIGWPLNSLASTAHLSLAGPVPPQAVCGERSPGPFGRATTGGGRRGMGAPLTSNCCELVGSVPSRAQRWSPAGAHRPWYHRRCVAPCLRMAPPLSPRGGPATCAPHAPGECRLCGHTVPSHSGMLIASHRSSGSGGSIARCGVGRGVAPTWWQLAAMSSRW